jgi:hypothetical protein
VLGRIVVGQQFAPGTLVLFIDTMLNGQAAGQFQPFVPKLSYSGASIVHLYESTTKIYCDSTPAIVVFHTVGSFNAGSTSMVHLQGYLVKK